MTTSARIRHTGDAAGSLAFPGYPLDPPYGRIVARFPAGQLSLHRMPDGGWVVVEAPGTADARTGPLTAADMQLANRRYYDARR